MNTPLFDIYFSGELVPGAALATVKKNLAVVFKADAARIDLLCNGQTHCIRKGVDQASAEKYQAVLHKAGAVVELRPDTAAATTPTAATAGTKPSMAERLAGMASAPPAPSHPSPPAATAAHEAETTPGGLSLAAAGSDLLRPEERRPPDAPDVAVPTFGVISQYQPPPAADTAPPPPAVDHISVADSYERLSAEAPPPPPAPDTSHLNMAKTEERLQPERPVEPLILNLDHLAVAPAGSDLLKPEERRQVTAQAPDTSHLSVDRG